MLSFFRKYQRPLLLVLALFALVTFSVTGSMMVFFQQCSVDPQARMPMLTLPAGEEYRVTVDDWVLAQDVLHFFVQRLPLLDLGLKEDTGESKEERGLERERLLDRLLILLCAARSAGIGVPDAVVSDFARSPWAQYYLRVRDMESYRQVVNGLFQTTIPRFEAALKEAMRIRFYIDSLLLGENLSTASVLEAAGKEGETFQVRFVAWEAEDREPALRQALPDDGKLQEFLEKLPEADKDRDFYDAKVVDLEVAWAPLTLDRESMRQAVAGTEPAEGTPGRRFLAGLEKSAPVTEVLEENRYDRDKARLYLLPAEPAASAPASQAASTPASQPASQPASAPAVSYRPLDRALRAEIRGILEREQAMNLVLAEAAEAARKEGSQFKLAEFLLAHFPFLKVARTGPLREADLSSRPPLEGWSQAIQALALASGELCREVGQSRTALFLFRVAEVKENVPRPLAEIRERLVSLYVKKEANRLAEQSAKDFLARLRELGRKANAEAVAGIEAELAAAVEKRFTAYKEDLSRAAARHREALADPTLPAEFRADFEAALKKAEEELGKATAKEEEYRREEREKREKELAKAELAKGGELFAAAAAEARVVEMPPFARNLNTIDRDGVEQEEDLGKRWLMGAAGVGRLAELEKGGVSTVLEDPTHRMFLVAHLQDRQLRDAATITPREIEEQLDKRRREAGTEFARKALSFEALRQRFRYRGFTGEDEYQAALEKVASRPASGPASRPAGE